MARQESGSEGKQYALAGSVEVLRCDTSLPDEQLLLSVDGRFFQVGGMAKGVVLCLRDEASTLFGLCQRLTKRGLSDASQERVGAILDSLADASALETCRSVDKGAATASRMDSRSYFGFRFTLLPERLLLPITSRLAVLFAPRLMATLIPALLVVQVTLWRTAFSGFRQIAASLTGLDYGVLLVANYAGLLLHELGHAAACIRRGVRHGPIGFGVYLVFPAFYTDVTEAWRLPRTRRIVVDAAGIYMTLLASGVVCIAYHHDARPVLAAIGGVLSATIWVNLWPFVRMDGYWLLSDVLGVPNLMAANREMTAYLFNAIRGSRCQRPQVLSIKPRALRALFVIYYPAFAVSVAWLLFKLARWYPPILFHSVPNLVWRVAVAYRRAGLSMDLLKAVMGLVLATLPAAGLLAYLARGLAAARRHIVSRGIAPPTEPKRHETYEKLEGQIGTEID